LKIFPESFRGPLKTLWQATFGLWAAIFPTLPLYQNSMTNPKLPTLTMVACDQYFYINHLL